MLRKLQFVAEREGERVNWTWQFERVSQTLENFFDLNEVTCKRPFIPPGQ